MIGPGCLSNAGTKESNLTVSGNRITVHREELPFHDSDRHLLQPSKVFDQHDPVTLPTSIEPPKYVTIPQQIREMMELAMVNCSTLARFMERSKFNQQKINASVTF